VQVCSLLSDLWSRMSGWPGGDLLSRALRHSTMGAAGFHGRVRNGIGWGTRAMTTRPTRHPARPARSLLGRSGGGAVLTGIGMGGGQRSEIGWQKLRSGFLLISDLCSLLSELLFPLGRGRSVERLGPVSCARRRACTSGLSTWWSTTALKRDLVLRWVSRLDAFSGYPVRA
jgi:hypothetical protein